MKFKKGVKISQQCRNSRIACQNKKKISMQNKKNTYQKEMAAVLKETVLSNFTTLEINIGEN